MSKGLSQIEVTTYLTMRKAVQWLRREAVPLWRKSFLLTVFLFNAGGAFAGATANEDVFESSAPILITEGGSARALAISPSNWKDKLPSENLGIFPPGARVMVFVTNIDLLPGEGANAFRVFAADPNGKKFRLTVESLQPLRGQAGIHGLTLRIYDPGGYNGQPKAEGEIAIWVSWRGNTSNRVSLRLGQSGRRISDDMVSVPVPSFSKRPPVLEVQSTGGDRKRFMEQAAFGPTPALDLKLRQFGLRRWIDGQFNTPSPTIPYPNFPLKPFDGNVGCPGDPVTDPNVEFCYRNHYYPFNMQKWMFLEALYGEDQLRRRMSWALHQIWVVAHGTVNQQRGIQEYVEILDRNAFGNYRDLMFEMTLSPAMGQYLDIILSTRADPNENYPRELLQLFTVGLNMLNQDGTLIRDNQGHTIPTYDQEKIDQFTKVFTGWTRCENGLNPACSNAVAGAPNFIDAMHVANPGNHDTTAKTLFDYPGAPNSTIPACTNCTTNAAGAEYANQSLNKTIDNIFNHPNVGPFIGKLLIQHLVTSDPSPAYVSRVAAAFNNNGAGVRGDMKSIVKAILLDPEARGSRKTDPTYGKLREPFQYLTNVLRTFDVRAGINSESGPATPPASCQNRSDGVLESLAREQGQNVWVSPTVFNYFPPDYVVPGTDILGPEFALANTSTSFTRNNDIFNLVFTGVRFGQPTAAFPNPYAPCGTSIDLSEAADLAAADPSGTSLTEGLNMRMMHGTMSEPMKSKIRAAINLSVDARVKASQAIFLVASSPQYQVQR